MADNISELSTTFKTPSYAKRTDTYGQRFRKGHRTAVMLQGKRPLTRSHVRPLRPL